METKNMLGGIVSLTVVVICVAVIMMPVLNEATTTEETFTNDGYYYMQKLSSSDDTLHTIEYTKSTLTYTFDGEAIDISELTSSLRYTIAAGGTDWVLRFSNTTTVGLQGVGTNFNFGGSSVTGTTVTLQSGTITATATTSSGSSTYTQTYDECWLYSTDATDYVMKKSDESAYLNADSEFLAIGVTTITSATLLEVSGVIEDYDVTVLYPSTTTITVTDAESVYEAVDGYLDLYALEELTFTVSDGTTSVDATYSYFIVPTEVTAELSQHLGSGEIALINAIPVLVIVSLVVAAVGMLVVRNRD